MFETHESMDDICETVKRIITKYILHKAKLFHDIYQTFQWSNKTFFRYFFVTD